MKKRPKLLSGPQIKARRELKGWSQAELAKKAGVSPSAVSMAENGLKSEGPRRKMTEALPKTTAKEFGDDLDKSAPNLY